MTGLLLKKKLMLEDYMAFFNDPDLPKLTMDQVHEIVTMHGFVRPKLKKLTIEGLKSIELGDPSRSTVGERSVYPCAPLEVEEVKADIRSLEWEECPIGSILAVGSSADGEEKERKRKKRAETLRKPPPVVEATPISASSAMTAIVEKKRRRKKKKKKATPVAASPAKKKKKSRKMMSISKALVVI